jgi:hypothetical protein
VLSWQLYGCQCRKPGPSKKAVLSHLLARRRRRGNKALRPASVKQERCAAGLVRNYWAQEGDDKGNLFGVYQRLITRPALLSASGQCIPGSGNVLAHARCGVAGAQQCGRAGQHEKAEKNYC